jgi:transcriptional regulator with XRE-family HTH domain
MISASILELFRCKTGVMNDIGTRIAELRAEHGQTLSTVGKAIGVSGAAVQQWETGASKNIKLANLAGLAAHFRVSMRWLVSGEGERKVEETQSEFEHQVLALFRQLGADGQHAALAHLNWMVSATPAQAPTPANPFARRPAKKLTPSN